MLCMNLIHARTLTIGQKRTSFAMIMMALTYNIKEPDGADHGTSMPVMQKIMVIWS